MIGLGSIKQTDKAEAEVPVRLDPVPLFTDSSIVTSTGGSGVKPDLENGRLLLSPGVYLVMLTATVAFTYARSSHNVTVAVVLGGDRRFHGPRQTVNGKNGNLNTWGVVTVPPGQPAACEVWAETDDEYPTKVTFSRSELLAVKLAHNPTEAKS